MIIEINHNNRSIGNEVLNLQKLSYRVEAEIINCDNIPPLREKIDDIIDSQETYLAFYEGREIAGVLTYQIDEDSLTICKMMVHPNHFKKGIASMLLNHVFKLDVMTRRIKVSTGAKNTPAIQLYKKYGFTEVDGIKISEDLSIKSFEKIIV
jgi:ribosomal protein S18 acetylase RimI-like enzyme